MDRPRPPIRILLIEDDEDDFVLVRDLLEEIVFSDYTLDWQSSYQGALAAMDSREHDVCLLDYRLGERTGLELLKEVRERSRCAPIIFLTSQGDYQIDLEAMKGGAADYLIKDQISASLLERSMRYALERRRADEALRESEKQLLTAQEMERKKIAKDLHDGAGQFLSAAKFGVENSLALLRQGRPEEGVKALTAVVSMVQEGLDEIRRISTDLWPSILSDLGILATINWFCREFENIYTGIRVDKHLDLPEDEIPESLKITLYRIIQEAFNNIAKHSRSDRVCLSLGKKGDRIELTIRDNGQGFVLTPELSASKSGRGLGLSSMRERSEISGGSLTMESAPGKGTVIKAFWPVRREE
jgi:signal transduction histidine kinase